MCAVRSADPTLNSKPSLMYCTAETHAYQRVKRRDMPPALQLTTQFTDLCPASAICMVKHI